MSVDELSPEERTLAMLVRDVQPPASSMSWEAVQRRGLRREPRRSLWPVIVSVAVAGALAASVLAGVKLHPSAGTAGHPRVAPTAHAFTKCPATSPTELSALPGREGAIAAARAGVVARGGVVLRSAVKLSQPQAPHGPGAASPPVAWVVALSVKWPPPACDANRPSSVEISFDVSDGAPLAVQMSVEPWPGDFDQRLDLGEPSPPPGTTTGTYPMTFWLHCPTSWFTFDNRTWYYENPVYGWGPKRQVPIKMGSPPQDEGSVTFLSPHMLEFRDSLGNTGRFVDQPPAVIGKSYTRQILLGSDANGEVRFMDFNSYGWDVSGTLPPADRGDAGVQGTITLVGPNEALLRDPSGVTLHMVRRGLLMCA